MWVAVVEHSLSVDDSMGLTLTEGGKQKGTADPHSLYMSVTGHYQCGKPSTGPRSLEMFITASVDMLGTAGCMIGRLVP